MKNEKSVKKKFLLFKKGITILFKTSYVYALLILALNILSGLLPPLHAIVYQKLLDCIVEMLSAGRWLPSGMLLSLLLTLLNVTSLALNDFVDFVKQVFSDKVDLYITDKVLHKAVLLPMETYDNAAVYNHINAAITRTSSNCVALLEALSEITYTVVKGCSFLYIILNFNWLIAVLSLLSMVPLLQLSTKINKYWYEIYFKRVEKNRLIQYLKILLVKNSNIKEIKLYNTGEKIIAFIKNQFGNFLKEDTKTRKRFLGKKVLVQFLDNIVTFGIKLWLLASAIYKGCSLGTIVLYFNAHEDLKISYDQFIRQFSALQNSLQYLESLDILEKEKVASPSEGRAFDAAFQKIEFRNVSFRYPGSDRYALRNISLEFERGKTYFIVGFNGSGKTTLLKLLLGLYQPTEGEILIDGVNIHSINLNQYYTNISAIFQDFIEYPFDVYENVAVRETGQPSDRLDTVLDYVGMREFVNGLPQKEHTMLMRDWTGGTDLSQGQWQKLAIARCIYGNSIISILDEPFSSVDAEAENSIISNLRRCNNGKLMIFITHRFSSISLTDQIVVLKEGSIVEKGTHEELIKNQNIYFRLYDSQVLN